MKQHELLSILEDFFRVVYLTSQLRNKTGWEPNIYFGPFSAVLRVLPTASDCS